MKLKAILFVFVVLLLALNVLPVMPAGVEAAYTITLNIDAKDCHNIKVSGQAYYSEGQIDKLWLTLRDSSGHTVATYDLKANPFVYTFKNVNYNQTYYVKCDCMLVNSKTTHFESSQIQVKTPLEPILAGTISDVTATTAKLTTKVTVNGNKLATVGYKVYKASDNSLAVQKVIMTNVTTGGTRSDTISGLKPYTSYNAYVYLVTELGWTKSFGPYSFKTRMAAITGIIKPSVTPTPTAKPTSTPSPSPTPTMTPTPTLKPTSTPTPTSKPTSTPTPTLAPTSANTPTPTSQATQTTAAETTQTQAPVETTPALTEPQQTSSAELTEESIPEVTVPNSGDDGKEFPWTVVIVALAAVAGLGFGIGGALMVASRKKK